MKLYHYSTKLHKTLLTRLRQGGVSLAEVKRSAQEAKDNFNPDSYFKHVSFFLEPLPLKEIGDIFEGTNHPVWNNGQVLFEHIVESSALPKDMTYHFVETPALTEYWHKLEGLENASDTDWKKALEGAKLLQLKNGEWGNDVKILDKVGRQLATGLLGYYQVSKASDHWITNQKRYAADVPHVMIYSDIGKFPVTQINNVIVGSAKPIAVSINPALRWD